GKGYGEFKTDLAEIVGAELEKIQARYKEITTGSYLDDVLEAGANKARPIARKKLAKVERKIGITIKKK
ncbi:MAG: tryptophan--tRNA ligase, partial [Coprobacillus cateniformis]